MTPEELEAFIRRSPKHKHIVKLYVPILVMGGVSTLFTAVVVGTSCGWGESYDAVKSQGRGES